MTNIDMSSEEQARSAAEWEKKLVAEGLSPEPRDDKGKIALQELVDSQEGTSRVNEGAVMDALYSYWMTRGETSFGHHKQIANQIETQLGLPSRTIDESLIKEAEGIVAVAQRFIHGKYSDIVRTNPTLAYNTRMMEKRLTQEASAKYPDWSFENIYHLVRPLVSG